MAIDDDFSATGGTRPSAVVKILQHALRPIRAMLRGMVKKAILSSLTDAQGDLQIVHLQLLADEESDDVERMEDYGFTGFPDGGEAEGVYLAVGGDNRHGVLLGCSIRTLRPKLEAGEVAMYSKHGQQILHKENREIHLTTTEDPPDSGTPPIKLGGDQVISGFSGTEIPRDDLVQANLGDIQTTLGVGAASVLIPSGSSAGTYPVVFATPYIKSATKSKVGRVV